MATTPEHDPRLPVWLNDLLNRYPFLVPVECVRTWALGYGASDNDADKPDWRSLRIGEHRDAMFMNAPFFLRLTFTVAQLWFGAFWFTLLSIAFGPSLLYAPLFCGVWVYVRYTPSVTGQLGWGHKLNGRWAILCRPWHTDKASAEGTLGPNLGQQTGWKWGPH